MGAHYHISLPVHFIVDEFYKDIIEKNYPDFIHYKTKTKIHKFPDHLFDDFKDLPKHLLPKKPDDIKTNLLYYKLKNNNLLKTEFKEFYIDFLNYFNNNYKNRNIYHEIFDNKLKTDFINKFKLLKYKTLEQFKTNIKNISNNYYLSFSEINQLMTKYRYPLDKSKHSCIDTFSLLQSFNKINENPEELLIFKELLKKTKNQFNPSLTKYLFLVGY